MFPASRRLPSASLVLALLGTTAMSGFLGACTTGGHRDLPVALSGPVDANSPEAARAVTQWAQAYAKKQGDPEVALGYARALKAVGSKEQAFELLKLTYQRDPNNGEVSSELGRLSLELGHLEVAKASLHAAEVKGVKDWKTLSAQGTLRAKQGDHTGAQQYFLAALQEQPDATSVINNLALSYALDGKADKAENLLQKTVASGKADKRVRQNLALVLGLEGKFDQARQVAAADVSNADATQNVSYLRNMLSTPTKVASLDGDEVDAEPMDGRDVDWQPFAGKQAPSRPVSSASRPKPASAPAPLIKPAAWTTEVVPAESGAPARVATLMPAERPAIPVTVKAAPKKEVPAGGAAPTVITPPAQLKTTVY